MRFHCLGCVRTSCVLGALQIAAVVGISIASLGCGNGAGGAMTASERAGGNRGDTGVEHPGADTSATGGTGGSASSGGAFGASATGGNAGEGAGGNNGDSSDDGGIADADNPPPSAPTPSDWGTPVAGMPMWNGPTVAGTVTVMHGSNAGKLPPRFSRFLL